MKKLLVLVLLTCLLCSAIYARENIHKDVKRSLGYFKFPWERHEESKGWRQLSTSTSTTTETAEPQNVTN